MTINDLRIYIKRDMFRKVFDLHIQIFDAWACLIEIVNSCCILEYRIL